MPAAPPPGAACGLSVPKPLSVSSSVGVGVADGAVEGVELPPPPPPPAEVPLLVDTLLVLVGTVVVLLASVPQPQTTEKSEFVTGTRPPVPSTSPVEIKRTRNKSWTFNVLIA